MRFLAAAIVTVSLCAASFAADAGLARDEPFECPSCATLMRRLFSAPSLQRMVGIGKRRR